MMEPTRAVPNTYQDTEALAHNVAEWLCGLARAGDGAFAVSLSGGSTPRRLYELLATPDITRRFPWRRSHWFWGDERCYDSPKTYASLIGTVLKPISYAMKGQCRAAFQAVQ